MKRLKILVVDDDQSIRDVIGFALRDSFDVTLLNDGQEAIERLYAEHYDIILLDIRMPRLNGIEALKKIQKISPGTDVVMLTATVNADITSTLMQMGAMNYLTKPFEMDDLLSIIFRLAKKKQIIDKSNRIQDQILESTRIGDLIGNSSIINSIRDYVSEVASRSATLLIMGDKGVEHDILAYMVFLHSSYQEVFKVINCAASVVQVEEEVFGRNYSDKDINEMPSIGFIKTGKGGTLYLKNIEMLPFPAQRKMVGWLEAKHKVGRDEKDIRLIVSTTTSLKLAVTAGRFDEELFHYLNETTVAIPALIDRQLDIPVLVDYYLQKYNKEFGKNCKFASESLALLYNYKWPGNTAEINSVMRRLVLISPDVISGFAIPMNIVINSIFSSPMPGVDYDMFVSGFVQSLVSSLNNKYMGNKDMIRTILGISSSKLEEIISATGKS